MAVRCRTAFPRVSKTKQSYKARATVSYCMIHSKSLHCTTERMEKVCRGLREYGPFFFLHRECCETYEREQIRNESSSFVECACFNLHLILSFTSAFVIFPSCVSRHGLPVFSLGFSQLRLSRDELGQLNHAMA